MMEPEEMTRFWKKILDDLCKNIKDAENDYNIAYYSTPSTKSNETLRVLRAHYKYNAALDACLEGQDPIVWKLSYSG